MARPLKESIDYFPLDNINDDKLDLIEAKHGILGWGIVIKLWRKIYGSNGYWYPWGEKEQLLFSKDNNVDINLVNDVIKDCVHWELFSEKMFETYSILTSKGVQDRYLEIIKRRKLQRFIKDYCIFDIDDYINDLKDDINVEIIDIKPQSKVKEIKGKGKQKKAKNFVKPSSLEVAEYAKSIDFTLDGEQFCDYYEARGWKYGTGKPMIDWKAAVRTWKKNKFKQPQSQTSDRMQPARTTEEIHEGHERW